MYTIRQLKEAKMLLKAIEAEVIDTSDRSTLLELVKSLRDVSGLEAACQFLLDYAHGYVHATNDIPVYLTAIDELISA